MNLARHPPDSAARPEPALDMGRGWRRGGWILARLRGHRQYSVAFAVSGQALAMMQRHGAAHVAALPDTGSGAGCRFRREALLGWQG